jgi:serine/threonine-protein kinase
MRGDVTTDTIVDGRYQIRERLGSGGMAAVYRAHDLQLGREVALKLLYPRFAEDASFVERFRREASAAAGLQHPNVVSVYDRGEWDGTSYIAMELVTGRTLRDLVQEHGPLDPIQAIDCTIGVLRAARFAHRRGIIHRDLKPHNVLVDGEGRTKVTDFGIAKAGASDMTETGSIMGTAQYMSPEQAQGLAVTPKSDLYAIGVLLYELLVGHPPFEGESAVSIALKQVSEQPVPPGRIVPAVPPELDAVVLHALAKDPEGRFADADEFIAALEEVRSLMTGGAAPGRNGTGSHVAPVVAAPRRRRLWPLLLMLLALVAAGAVFAATQLGGGGEERPVPDVRGQDITQATQRLRQEGFEVRAVRRRSVRPRDRVISQDPGGGRRAEEGSTVEIRVSDGPGIDQVPRVAGMRRSAAIKALEDAGFRVDEDRRSSERIAENRAISTDPAAGTQLEGGQTVRLVISTGPPRVDVPVVVGRGRDEARAALEDAGFEVDVSEQEDEDREPGTVLSQSPNGGRAPKGSSVAIVVAKRPARVAVPSVAGQQVDDARRALRDAGLRVGTTDVPVQNPDQDGVVITQDPAPGTQVERGSRVNLAVARLEDQPDQGAPAPDQEGTPPGQEDGATPPGQQEGGPPGQGNQGQGQGGDLEGFGEEDDG